MDWHEFMAETEANLATFSKEVPETVKGFAVMGKAAKGDGALSEKTKEFIALGIAIATRCDSCIGFHVRSLVRLKAVERLHGELDEELVGGDAALVGGLFDALPLLGGDADVLLDGLNHGRLFEFLARFGAESVPNRGRIVAESKLPDW